MSEECTCPAHGRWLKAEDIDRLVKELDVALNGPGGAKRPLLCDVVGQVKDGRWKLVSGELIEAAVKYRESRRERHGVLITLAEEREYALDELLRAAERLGEG